MTRTVRLRALVPANREIVIRLPEDIPPGAARIVVAVTSEATLAPEVQPRRTLGDLLGSELFGMWSDRDDIADSVEFTRELRAKAWQRA